MFGWLRKSHNPALSDEIVRYQQATRHARAVSQTGTGRLAQIFNEALDQPEWDYALDLESSKSAVLYAAAYTGFQTPFDAEEKDIIQFLTSRFAGRKISIFVWSLYADCLRKAERQDSQLG